MSQRWPAGQFAVSQQTPLSGLQSKPSSQGLVSPGPGVLHCSAPLSLVGVGVGATVQLPKLPGTAQDSPTGQVRELQQTNSSLLQRRPDSQSVSLPQGPPGPCGVGVAVEVNVGLGVAVFGAPQDAGTVD